MSSIKSDSEIIAELVNRIANLEKEKLDYELKRDNEELELIQRIARLETENTDLKDQLEEVVDSSKRSTYLLEKQNSKLSLEVINWRNQINKTDNDLLSVISEQKLTKSQKKRLRRKINRDALKNHGGDEWRDD